MKTSVLIIDDEQKLRGLLARLLQSEGYEVSQAGTAAEAHRVLARAHADVILCDVKLPDASGVDLCAELKAAHPYTEVILLTAYGNIPDGVRAMRNGAFDYLVKGDDNDKIIPLLSQAAQKVAASPRQKTIGESSGGAVDFDAIIGESPAIKSAITLARKVAPTDTAVLLTGETGSGKEVFAQAIHSGSARRGNPFVALNCSGFSKELLESTLFGHKAGAFTGATKDKKGLIEEAAGGTLFLDEIGEMPAELQPKLLRFLEDGSYYAVGDTKVRKADVRLVSATNRALEAEISDGHFRSDLFYRIATFSIELPPLRERVADIPLLAAHFLKLYAAKTGKHITGIGKEAADALKRNPWKGNIRELKNVLERAVILEDGATLSAESLPPDATRGNSSAVDLASVERAHIRKVLAAAGGNKAEAARLLGIGIATLYRKVEEYRLK